MRLSVAFPIGGERSRSRAIAEAGRSRLHRRWWIELLAIGWVAWLYDATTDLAHLRLHTALANARGVLHLEQSLHIDPELSLDRWLASRHLLGVLLSNYYDNAHWVVTMGLLAWLWWRRADIYRPLRNALVLVNVIGFVVFWRYPVAPPRMLSGFTDIVSSSNAVANFHHGPLASHANELAAMPSLHMAWAAWCTLALWRMCSRRWVRVLSLCYPCLTAFAVLATGNHFVLDLLGGLAALALTQALLAARPLLAWMQRQSLGIWRALPARARRRPALGQVAAIASRGMRASVRLRGRRALSGELESARD